jgi:hypothetical protein
MQDGGNVLLAVALPVVKHRTETRNAGGGERIWPGHPSEMSCGWRGTVFSFHDTIRSARFCLAAAARIFVSLESSANDHPRVLEPGLDVFSLIKNRTVAYATEWERFFMAPRAHSSSGHTKHGRDLDVV